MAASSSLCRAVESSQMDGRRCVDSLPSSCNAPTHGSHATQENRARWHRVRVMRSIGKPEEFYHLLSDPLCWLMVKETKC